MRLKGPLVGRELAEPAEGRPRLRNQQRRPAAPPGGRVWGQQVGGQQRRQLSMRSGRLPAAAAEDLSAGCSRGRRALGVVGRSGEGTRVLVAWRGWGGGCRRPAAVATPPPKWAQEEAATAEKEREGAPPNSQLSEVATLTAASSARKARRCPGGSPRRPPCCCARTAASSRSRLLPLSTARLAPPPPPPAGGKATPPGAAHAMGPGTASWPGATAGDGS